jgi:hypothetical protein
MDRRQGWRAVALTVLVTAGALGLGSTAEAQAPPEAAAPNHDYLIGRTMVGSTPPPVRGWTYAGGTILREDDDPWMAVYRTPTGRYVFVTKYLLRRNASGTPVWRILDTSTSRSTVGSQRYWNAPYACRRGSNEIPAVGLAQGRNPYWNPAIQLWNVNLGTGRMAERGTAGVVCFTGNPD